jgi:hypothetical protein
MAIMAPHIVDRLLEVASPEARILEVGCGDKALRDVLPGDYVGLDLPASPRPTRRSTSSSAWPCSC